MIRPQSASSRSRMDPGVKVFSNSLYDAGDILAGQPEPPAPAKVQHVVHAPHAPALASGGSQKFQQQRVLAAQKRMERLQMGGLATSNDSVAVVSLSSSSSRPGTPRAPQAVNEPFGAQAGLSSMPAAYAATPPSAAAPPGGRFDRTRAPGSASSSSGDGGHASTGLSAGPWQGSAPGSSGSAQHPVGPSRVKATYEDDEDLEVETLEEPMIRPGTASAQQPSGAGRSSQELKQPHAAAVDLSNLALFLRRPAPHASSGTVLCCIERCKAGLGKSPIYRFHLELPGGGFHFLLSARKRLKTATSSYIISTSPDDLSRHSSSCIAKLRSNFVGTGFSIYLTNGSSSASSSRPGSGAAGAAVAAAGGSRRQLVSGSAGGFSPLAAGQRSRQSRGSSSGGSSSGGRATADDANNAAWQQAAAGGSSSGVKQEVGAVQYEYNVLGTRGPRRLSVAVPHVDEAGNVLWMPSSQQDSMAERLRVGGTATNHLVVLRNKEPKWNSTLNAYCLNFNGRVTEASVKNFQLATADDPDTVVLQFGKLSGSCFTCDFTWPLSPLQAFCICLSSFDHKLACE